jgi:glycosyltransferase involved in cell wall biosynthesis
VPEAQATQPTDPQCVAVCHVISGDLWAGAEVQVAALLKYLSREAGIRLCAIVLNPGRLAEEMERLKLEHLVIPESQHGFLEILRRATSFLRRQPPDVLHSHRYKENLLAALLARRLRVPVLVRTRHGLEEPQGGGRALKQKMIHVLDRWVARRSVDRVIAVSTEMARKLGHELGEAKIAVIPNGVDLERVRSPLGSGEARERIGLPAQSRVLGVACRLEPIKRLDIFLRAAKLLAEVSPQMRFVIAGDGRERGNLEALAGKLGLADRVFFLGHRNDMFDVLRALDLLVISSDHEGLPMVLLEALALGIPVVARRVGGIPEVITHGETGILVESGSPEALSAACQELLSQEVLRRRISEAGCRLVAERYSARRTAREVANLYRTLRGAA